MFFVLFFLLPKKNNIILCLKQNRIVYNFLFFLNKIILLSIFNFIFILVVSYMLLLPITKGWINSNMV